MVTPKLTKTRLNEMSLILSHILPPLHCTVIKSRQLNYIEVVWTFITARKHTEPETPLPERAKEATAHQKQISIRRKSYTI